MADVLGHDLWFNVLDPAVNIVHTLLVQHVAVGVKQTFTLVSRRILQLLPLLAQLVQSRINDTRQIRLLDFDSLSVVDQFLQLILVRLYLWLECLHSMHSQWNQLHICYPLYSVGIKHYISKFTQRTRRRLHSRDADQQQPKVLSIRNRYWQLPCCMTKSYVMLTLFCL